MIPEQRKVDEMRILIVDDLARARQSVKALLSTYPGVDGLLEAANGREALALAESWLPDAVLMDVCMPDPDGAALDGLAATQAIKARWPQMQVIVLSMYGDYEAQALDAGADAFVNKGEPPARLLQALDAAFGQR